MHVDIVISSEGANSLHELKTLWLALHHHHRDSAPGLAPYVDDETSWLARRLAAGQTNLSRATRRRSRSHSATKAAAWETIN
jgi:hypothetical protein